MKKPYPDAIWAGVGIPDRSRNRLAFAASFQLERETKGAVRYMEVDDKDKPIQEDFKIGILYFRKSAFGAKIPERLTITVDVS